MQNLYADLQTQTFVVSPTNPRAFVPCFPFYAGENKDLTLFGLMPSGNPSAPYNIQAITGAVATLSTIASGVYTEIASTSAFTVSGNQVVGTLSIPANITFPANQQFIAAVYAEDLTVNGEIIHVETACALRNPSFPITNPPPLPGSEPALGNPTTDGSLLSSLANGVRSWLATTAWGRSLLGYANAAAFYTANPPPNSFDPTANETITGSWTFAASPQLASNVIPAPSDSSNRFATTGFVARAIAAIPPAPVAALVTPYPITAQSGTVTLPAGTRRAVLTRGLTGNLTIVFPLSSGYAFGSELVIEDALGYIGAHTLSVLPQGSDAIGGGGVGDGAIPLTLPGSVFALQWLTDGAGDWQIIPQASGGVTSVNGQTGAITIPAGNQMFVDAVNGVDANALRNRIDKPFLTLQAAKAAAQSGDTIFVGPGTYDPGSTSLLKNGVNWHFANGTIVSATNNSSVGMLDDNGVAIACKVTGAGVFRLASTITTGNNRARVVSCRAAGSVISVEADTITCDGVNAAMAVEVLAGKLFVRAREIQSPHATSLATVWWENGDMYVTADHISGAYWAVGGECDAAPTGDMFVQANKIETIPTATSGQIPGGVIVCDSANATSAMWVEAQIIKAGLSTQPSASVSTSGNGKLYVNTQKLFGSIYLTGGLVYINADKIQAIDSGGLITALGTQTNVPSASANYRISIKHWDDYGFAGPFQLSASPGPNDDITDAVMGSVQILGGDYVASGTNTVAVANLGKCLLKGFIVNTSANATVSPLTISANSSDPNIIDGCTLISDSSQSSVAGSGILINYNSRANTASGSAVTVLVNALTVDANVQ